MKCSICGMSLGGVSYTSSDGDVCWPCKESETTKNPKYPQYRKRVRGWAEDGVTEVAFYVDVYGILVVFNVTNPATAHAVKKLLRAGTDHNETLTDLQEAKDALDRAMEIERGKA